MGWKQLSMVDLHIWMRPFGSDTYLFSRTMVARLG
jgi:hypothetical protein